MQRRPDRHHFIDPQGPPAITFSLCVRNWQFKSTGHRARELPCNNSAASAGLDVEPMLV